MALAAAMMLGLPATDAQALSLGRASVQSFIGAPLQAEIELPQITPDELSTLTVTLASQETFRAAGLEYSPVLGSLHISFHRRANGTSYLRLTSDRLVNEPFVDLLIEATWATGRIVRDYTLLFDPPALRPPAPPVAAQVPAAPQRPAVAAPAVAAPPTRPALPPRSAAPAPAPAPASSPAQGLRVPRPPSGLLGPVPAPAAAPVPSAAAPAPAPSQRLDVKPGDTAGALAAAHKPSSISLDQMLVALLHSNPQAFAGGNMNRLKAGVVLEIPSAEQASRVGAAEARQIVVAQSRDFNEFRRRLAEGVSSTPQAEAASRAAAGRLQAQVEEKRPGTATPDKLTLSKGAVQGKSREDGIAQDRAAQDAATRVAELNRNIDELNRLTAATGAVGGAAPAQRAASAASGGLPVGTPVAAAQPPVTGASAAVPAEPPVAAASGPSAGSAGVTASTVTGTATSANAGSSGTTEAAPAAKAASAPASAARKTADPQPMPQPDLTEQLLENPLLPAAGGGIAALLLGLALFRLRQRRKANHVDSSFLESRLQPDSFFGASGGQRIDTAEGASVTGSSMVYSPSQLDAAGDVDPVAEADVYLAYGRDLQAEEILKEALRTTPQRVAIHAKMLEIFAKRRDTKAFELLAAEAHALTQGQGPEWEHINTLGQELDPGNPLYQPGGLPSSGAQARTDGGPRPALPATPEVPSFAPQASAAALAAHSAAAAGADAQQNEGTPAQDEGRSGPTSEMDLDLDLDAMDGDSTPALLPAAASAPAAGAAAPQPPADEPALGALPALDFGDLQDLPPAPAAQAPAPAPADELDNALDFDLDLTASPADEPAASSAPGPVSSGGLMDFDLDSLSLDLDMRPAAPTAAAAPSASGTPAPDAQEITLDTFDAPGPEDGDPLATKLALAEEFNAIGDADGARSLAEEVLAEASGELRQRAERFLTEIG